MYGSSLCQRTFEVGISARFELVEYVRGPCGPALARYRDERVALAVLNLGLKIRVIPVHGAHDAFGSDLECALLRRSISDGSRT